MATSSALVRKQFLISKNNIRKINAIAKKNGTSATEVVRTAIDSFDPDTPHTLNKTEQELLDFAAQRLNEAITLTQKTRRSVNKTMNNLSSKEA